MQVLPLVVEASIGIALFPDHGLDAETLLRAADVAMYIAKELKNGYGFFDGSTDQLDLARLTLSASCAGRSRSGARALSTSRMRRVATGEVHSVEALLRWNHPARGLIPPTRSSTARETERIRPLTLYVEFPQVAGLLERSEVAASALRLELTEATIFVNPFRTKLVRVEEWPALGVGLSIDDFGNGYSSVAYLTRLPPRELKIDRSFVMRMMERRTT